MDTWFRDAFNALENATSKQLPSIKSVLFLVGQSGVGKTSTVQCLCQKYNAKLLYYPSTDGNIKAYGQSIWDNDDTHYMTFNSRRTIDIRDDSQMDKFDIFLNRSKRFQSLSLMNGLGGNTGGNTSGKSINDNKSNRFTKERQVILITELPYVGKDRFLHRFREIIEKMCRSTRHIVIFEITTEFESTRDDLQVFGLNVTTHQRVSKITFNAVNKTLMTKRLNNILEAERLKPLISNTKELIDDVIEGAHGDLRNAIQTLQMRVVELSYSDDTESNLKSNGKSKGKSNGKSIKKRASKRKKVAVSTLKSENVGGGEQNLSIFHSLGKVLYAKKEIDPEIAIERSDVDCVTFNSLLFENFGDFFIYNELFWSNEAEDDSPKQVDEFGFEIATGPSKEDEVFEKYTNTLGYFADADLCCASYQRLRYSDTSTDLRSTCNNIQFGSQLYPAIYGASIGSRGYLVSHDEPPKVRMSGNWKGKMMAFRGSTEKKIKSLKKELQSTLEDTLMAKCTKYGEDGESLGEGQLGLARTLMCHPTSLYVDVLPMVSNIRDRSTLERECGIGNLCSSLVRESNWYSMKYDKKTFTTSRLEFVQKSIAHNQKPNENVMDVDVDDEAVSDDIEDFD